MDRIKNPKSNITDGDRYNKRIGLSNQAVTWLTKIQIQIVG